MAGVRGLAPCGAQLTEYQPAGQASLPRQVSEDRHRDDQGPTNAVFTSAAGHRPFWLREARGAVYRQHLLGVLFHLLLQKERKTSHSEPSAETFFLVLLFGMGFKI